MQGRLLWRMLRTPLLLASGWLWLVMSPTAWPALVMWQSRFNPFHDFYCAPPSTHDCFFFLPAALLEVETLARLLSMLLALWILVEAASLRCSKIRSQRVERWIIVAMLGVAMASWSLLGLRGPNIRLLPIMSLGVVCTWVFLMLNSGLSTIDRLMKRSQAERLLAWTFPVSDVLCVGWHRRQLGRSAGLWRCVPTLTYLAILVVMAQGQWRLAAGSLRAQRMPLAVYNPHQVTVEGSGLWVAEAISRYDAGLWRYDGSPQSGDSYVRVADLRTFAMQDGFFYLYDGFDSTVRKIEASSRRLMWDVPLPPDAGPVEVAVGHERVYALSHEGYLAHIGLHGQIVSQRRLPARTRYLHVLSDRRSIFVSLDELAVRIAGADSTQDERLLLPLSGRVDATRRSFKPDLPVLVDAELSDQNRFHVASLWGEIFRYDISTRQWLPSIHVAPGLRDLATDAAHGLLFAYNAARGYVEVLDLDSGQHLAYVRATSFGNRLSTDTQARVAFLGAHGPGFTSIPKPGGLYRLAYDAVIQRRFAQLASGTIQ